MSPHDIEQFGRERMEAAFDRFEWSKHVVTRQHERDSSSKWVANVWKNNNSEYLFDEADLTKNLAEELCRIAGIVANSS